MRRVGMSVSMALRPSLPTNGGGRGARIRTVIKEGNTEAKKRAGHGQVGNKEKEEKKQNKSKANGGLGVGVGAGKKKRRREEQKQVSSNDVGVSWWAAAVWLR